MTEPGEMDELRARLRRVEQDAAAARILAGGADRDVGGFGAELREFRAQNNTLHNATREDLGDLRTEMNQRFEQVDQRFEQVDRRFEQVDANFLAVRGRLDGLAAGLDRIVELLDDRRGS